MSDTPLAWSRRRFLRAAGALAGRAFVGSSLFAAGAVSPGCGEVPGTDVSFFGPLQEPDENGIRLPLGFRSRVLARTGDVVPGTQHVWHGAPDGGAVFPLASGWVYVSNAELLPGGGVGALLFDRYGRVIDAYPICSGTRRNCAGGATPWGSWLSCEEVGDGQVYECDPLGLADSVLRPALGRFNHEAVAVDPVERRLYLTEDRLDGRLYRFTPDLWGNLGSGLLEVAEVAPDTSVRWHPLRDPGAVGTETRHQVPESTPFLGGEGIVYDRGHVYFATKFDDKVWDLDVAAGNLDLLYARVDDPLRQLSGVDNVTSTPAGELIVAEDGGNMELVQLSLEGHALPLLRIEGQGGSELAGPAFDPTGRRLYVSSQRGTDGRGITYEIEGPFRVRWRRELQRLVQALAS